MRLGVSWSVDGIGKGVGSGINPAMAALVMSPHPSEAADAVVEEASPRLSGKAPAGCLALCVHRRPAPRLYQQDVYSYGHRTSMHENVTGSGNSCT